MPADLRFDPDLTVAMACKDAGGNLFKEGDSGAADAEYGAALVLIEHDMAWPEAEALALACYSNRAMCLLKLGRAAEALTQCGKGLALPGAVQSCVLHCKLWARKAQACLECDPPRTQDASDALVDARSRGLWQVKGMGSKFKELAALLPDEMPLPPLPPLPTDCPGRMPLKLAIAQMIQSASLSDMSAADLIQFFGGLLRDSIMEPAHVTSIEPSDGASLPWALCFALCECNGDATVFSRLLRIFVSHFGTPIDMRMMMGRTPLMFAAASHRAGATSGASHFCASRVCRAMLMRSTQASGAISGLCPRASPWVPTPICVTRVVGRLSWPRASCRRHRCRRCALAQLLCTRHPH
jgi:hypothetical protein